MATTLHDAWRSAVRGLNTRSEAYRILLLDLRETLQDSSMRALLYQSMEHSTARELEALCTEAVANLCGGVTESTEQATNRVGGIKLEKQQQQQQQAQARPTRPASRPLIVPILPFSRKRKRDDDHARVKEQHEPAPVPARPRLQPRLSNSYQ